MNKIELPDESKLLFVGIANKKFKPTFKQEETAYLSVLEDNRLIKQKKDEQGNCIQAELTTKGLAYITMNPQLKNPSFWDDKHAVVDHVINFIEALNPF